MRLLSLQHLRNLALLLEADRSTSQLRFDLQIPFNKHKLLEAKYHLSVVLHIQNLLWVVLWKSSFNVQ